jgi:hypothetical protein
VNNEWRAAFPSYFNPATIFYLLLCLQRQWPLVPGFLLPSGGGQLVPAQMLSVIKEAMAR